MSEVYPPGTVVHADGTIDSQACHGCGVQTLSILEVTDATTGEVVLSGFMCRACQSVAKTDLSELRAIRDGYLADGLNEAQAAQAMLRLCVGPERAS